MLNFFSHLSKLEKIFVSMLSIVVFLSFGQIIWAFYEENSELIPSEGGIYREGLVGKIHLINPVFALTNDTDQDICQLVFSGLIKYNPRTKTLENDIATHTLSFDKRVYTFTLRDNVTWHDGTPVTADDIVFTYNTVIQNQDFPNSSLRVAFDDVYLTKIDKKTITFTLRQPYKFFLANLTIGLLPKHILETIPVSNLDKSEFNQNPIGTGPYKIHSITNEHPVSIATNAKTTTGVIKIHLKGFDEYYSERPYIQDIILNIYPDFKDLYSDISNLDGIKAVPKKFRNLIADHGKFRLFEYELNQYAAVFINTLRTTLSDSKVRLGLQLATNKKEIIDAISEKVIIDTPLLEIDRENWMYQFDPEKAAGAFFDTEWKIPGKTEDKKTGSGSESAKTEEDETSNNTEKNKEAETEEVTYITEPNKGQDWITDTDAFWITGKNPEDTTAVYVDDYKLKKFNPSKKAWSFRAEKKLGNLQKGENIFSIYGINKDGKKVLFDSIKITLISDKEDLQKAIEKAAASSTGTEVPPSNEEPETPPENNTNNWEGIIRENKEGDKLSFRLVTSDAPEEYATIANFLKEQWKQAGADLQIEVLPRDQFSEKVASREYDLLLYGQNLGHNLDAYPYWHSSRIGENGYNLSEYGGLDADALLEEIRETHDEETRTEALDALQDVISQDTPAIFLYTPTYVYALDVKINNAEVNNLALNSDRFNTLSTWFIKHKRTMKDDRSWWGIFGWLWSKF